MKKWARHAFLFLLWVLVAGVILQTLLAGLALSGAGTYWVIHESLGLVVGPLLGFIIILLAFASRLPRRTHRLAVILSTLAILQSALIYPGRHLGLVVPALHPVNALVLFGLGLKVVTEVRQLTPPPLGTADE